MKYKSDRIELRWKKKKHKCAPCPECQSLRIGLNDHLHGVGRFSLECDDCHWCGAGMPTIALAVWKWNRDSGKQYAEMIKRAYMGR